MWEIYKCRDQWCGRHKSEDGVGYINVGMEGMGDT